MRLSLRRPLLDPTAHAAPRFQRGDVHIFEDIARTCGIHSVSVDPNFKVGAKSKKDPTVWVVAACGCRSLLHEAKRRVIALFDVRANRVTLRVNVPHEHHFFVIGKKGANMKRVMSLTGCHVHFPDTNRTARATAASKAVVSITGAPDSVHDARVLIRGLLPLTISFDVPPHVRPEDVHMTPAIRALADEHDVTIFFKQRAGRGPLALVKGTRARGHVVELAAGRLQQLWTGGLLEMPEYTLQVHLPCAQHALLIGPGGTSIKDLMAMTATSIRFPDAHANSAVFISGGRDATKVAHAHLQGQLPLTLMFDMTEACTLAFLATAQAHGTGPEELAVAAATGLRADVAAKLRGATLTITLRGTESHSAHLFMARTAILRFAGVPSDAELGQAGMAVHDPAFDAMVDDPKFAPPLHTMPYVSLVQPHSPHHDHPGAKPPPQAGLLLPVVTIGGAPPPPGGDRQLQPSWLQGQAVSPPSEAAPAAAFDLAASPMPSPGVNGKARRGSNDSGKTPTPGEEETGEEEKERERGEGVNGKGEYRNSQAATIEVASADSGKSPVDREAGVSQMTVVAAAAEIEPVLAPGGSLKAAAFKPKSPSETPGLSPPESSDTPAS